MVLAETNAELPLDIVNFPVGRISLEEPSTVETAVRAMLPRLRPAIPPMTSSEERISASGPIDRSFAVQSRRKKGESQLLNRAEAFQQLQSLRAQRLPHAAFENFVASLFNKAGYLVSSEQTTDDRGVDLTIWLDEVAPIFSNPILVELKTDLTQSERWPHAADQLHRYLNAAGATCGLLVSLNPLTPDIPRYTTSLPLVTTFSIDELIPLIASGELARELIRRRNAAVHGVAK